MRPVLEVRSVTKSFGGLVAVNNFSMEVREREIVGLIGPNGAGKTTLLNLVTGFLKPDKGQIMFMGEEITGLPPHKICVKGVARTFQLIKPFPKLSILDAIAVGALVRVGSKAEAYRRAQEVIEFLGLKEPHRLCESLNVVEEKLVELGRALATNPKLLLIDEIAAGLRPSEVEDIKRVIKIIRDEYGVSIVVVEHVMPLVMGVSDRIVVMSSGSKVTEGKPEEVASNPKVISIYLGERRGRMLGVKP